MSIHVMKKTLTLFVALLISHLVIAQDSYLKITGVVTKENKTALDSCWIKIKKNDVFVDSVLTDASGRFEFDSLAVNHFYEIHFSKATYSYKFVQVDMNGVDAEEYTKFPVDIDMALFSTVYIVDRKINFMKTSPVAKGFYNPKTYKIEWNGAYFLEMKNKIEEAKK